MNLNLLKWNFTYYYDLLIIFILILFLWELDIFGDEKMNIPYKAEQLEGFSNPDRGFSAERIKVIHGWIVRHVAWDYKMGTLSESSVFVPDKDYSWKIK